MDNSRKIIDLEQIKRIRAGHPSMEDMKQLSREEINRIQYMPFFSAIGKQGYTMQEVFDEIREKATPVSSGFKTKKSKKLFCIKKRQP